MLFGVIRTVFNAVSWILSDDYGPPEKSEPTSVSTPVAIPEPPQSPHFLALLERLKIAQQRPLGTEVAKVLNKDEISAIMDYFLNFADSDSVQKHMTNIANLKPEEGYRLDKVETKLPRTVTILCDKNNDLKLIVETKSKLAGGEKIPEDKRKIRDGAAKSGKAAWRLDSSEVALINLSVLLDEEEDEKEIEEHMAELKQEVEISHIFNSKFMAENELGPRFKDKKDRSKVSLYSDKAEDDLKEFIGSEETLAFLSKVQEWKLNQDKFILNLLEAVKLVHDKGLVFQDLKPENILVVLFYKLVEGCSVKDYYLKLTDYALVRNEATTNEEAISTNDYESPEIALYTSHPFSQHYQYFSDAKKDSYARLLGKSITVFEAKDRALYKAPHKANDMWALGLIIYLIRHAGKYPIYPDDQKLIENDPLIKGLLEPYRVSRLDIDKAITLHKEQSGLTSIDLPEEIFISSSPRMKGF